MMVTVMMYVINMYVWLTKMHNIYVKGQQSEDMHMDSDYICSENEYVSMMLRNMRYCKLANVIDHK